VARIWIGVVLFRNLRAAPLQYRASALAQSRVLGGVPPPLESWGALLGPGDLSAEPSGLRNPFVYDCLTANFRLDHSFNPLNISNTDCLPHPSKSGPCVNTHFLSYFEDGTGELKLLAVPRVRMTPNQSTIPRAAPRSFFVLMYR